MAVTGAPTGTLFINPAFKNTLSGDMSGEEATNATVQTIIFAASGGTAPTVTGWFQGTMTAAAGDILLAHATDPLQSMGSASYCQGFTVAGSKLKLLYIVNNDTTNTITIQRGATNGLPIFLAAEDGMTIPASGIFLYYNKAGTAALTTGSNDKLTISVSAGSPTAYVLAVYGA